MPPLEWSSRGEMMRARERAVDQLERAYSYDWRRLVVGGVSLALLLVGEFFLFGVVKLSVGVEWTAGRLVVVAALGVIGALALVGGGKLGVRTWRRGRRIVTALVAWEELTDRVAPDGSPVPFMLREVEDAESDAERRHIWWRNWVWFRTREITFTRVGRVLTGTFLLLAGGSAAGGGIGASVEQGQLTGGPGVFLAGMIIGLTVFFYGCVVVGGAQRFGNAMARREFRMRRGNRRIRRERRAAEST